jgi:hypothetical protein
MINNSLYKISEYPNFHPRLDEYERIDWFKAEKRKCIEGYWVSGQWMPGPLYHYINFHHILIETPASRGLVKGLPLLRDNDWKLFRLYEEARGFSGFADDPNYTCNRLLGPERDLIEKLNLLDWNIDKGYIRREDLNKEYIPAREYLAKIHKKSYGKPLYHNDAKNFMSMQGRGGGKSYGAAGIIAQNWLYSGAIDYDTYLKSKVENNPLSSDTVLGAYDTKWSSPLLTKVLYGIDELPGSVEADGEYFDSPLYKSYTGSKAENSELKMGNSVLYHRTFRNNPLAGNAGRPNLVVLDEIGFFQLIVETLEALEGSQASKEKKTLVTMLLGTGGYTSGSSVLYAEKVFRDPAQYNCLEFEDEWENTGKICHFVPITHTRTKHKKGPNLITDEASALLEEQIIRKAKKGDTKAFQAYITNNPILPSEIFLVPEGGQFPTILLKDQLGEVLGGKYKNTLDGSYKGWFKYNDKGDLTFEESQNEKPIRSFPLEKGEERTGLVELYQRPVRGEFGEVLRNRYIAGIDVVDKSSGRSLPSIIMLDLVTDRIVAEYTGRTDNPKFFYEQCRRMLQFYGGIAMYEQNLIGLYTYFESEKSLNLLADTPHQLRQADYKPGTNNSKGIHNTGNIASIGIEFINSWLIKKAGPNTENLMLNTIYSPALLKELIRYNPEGNFDRVSALIMLFWYYETLSKNRKEERKEKRSFLTQDYFINRGIVASPSFESLQNLFEQK